MTHSVLPVNIKVNARPSNRDKTDELVYWINQRYGVETQGLRLYLTGLVQTIDSTPAWIVADCGYHVFWEHLYTVVNRLGGEIVSLDKLKVLRPRYANNWIGEITRDRTTTTLFTEAKWEKQPTAHQRNLYGDVEREVMRRRVYAKPVSPVMNGAVDELTERVYKWVKWIRALEVRVDQITDYQLVLCEIMGKIGPYSADAMSRNLAALGAGYRAVNSPIEEGEVQLQVYQTLVQSVRPWDRELIAGLGNGDGFRSIEQLAGAVKGKQKKQVEKLLVPWVENGLVDWQVKRTPGRARMMRGRWIGPTALGWEMVKMMRGEARWW